jgi:hypothetical protein
MPGIASFGKKREIGQIKFAHESPHAKIDLMGLFDFNDRKYAEK